MSNHGQELLIESSNVHYIEQCDILVVNTDDKNVKTSITRKKWLCSHSEQNNKRREQSVPDVAFRGKQKWCKNNKCHYQLKA